MKEKARRAIAIVGVGAVLPDAPDAPTFWDNLTRGRYSISDVPADRWNVERYYHPDPSVPDKTYSKIGGWVHTFEWDPLRWRLPIPPRVSAQMDRTQIWAIVATRQALADYGWPQRPLDQERTAVVLGNAMAGDKHYLSAARILFPEYAEELENAPTFAGLPAHVRGPVLEELRAGIGRRLPEINEDTMPGELANVIAGRIANLFDLHGPNYVVDAACASAMAGITAAIAGLEDGAYDAVLTGGIDANMSPSTFTKFCKIGALSATGSRPYADGADGFVMGEGGVMLLMKRLADAEAAGDRIYAVIRGVGGASDGKGKGITAPNPIGQELSIIRAWEQAGLSPATATLLEGHGTSTRVGDVIEAEGIARVFGRNGVRKGSIPLGSVKSNMGHLKGAAGAVGILKAALALHHRQIPPSLNFDRPNPNIDFGSAPFYVATELRPWDNVEGGARRAGVSAFGFGGTNFHTILEEYIPGRLDTNGRTVVGFTREQPAAAEPAPSTISGPKAAAPALRTPLRGALVVGGSSLGQLRKRLVDVLEDVRHGHTPPPAPPAESDLRAPKRIAIDYGESQELAAKIEKTLKAIDDNTVGRWKALRAQGIFLGEGAPAKAAFLFTGQGSQYVNMVKDLKAVEPIVAETFAEADSVMAPLLGRPLSSYIFVDEQDPEALKRLEHDLRQTEITQPAVLATDIAMMRVLGAYGIGPDMVTGHSLGEYAALVASGALAFGDALRAVSARAHAMREVSMQDNGIMAAVTAPLDEVQRLLDGVDGYVVIANINSTNQAVIGGATAAVHRAMEAIKQAGYRVVQLSVSHAFHTAIVGPASEPLRRVLQQFEVRRPTTPVISNVTGEFYPSGPGSETEMVDLLARQVAAPVQFVKGLNTLYDAGARVFVEVGPKRALYSFVEEVLGGRDDVTTLFTNHPRIGEAASLNMTLCGFYAAGHGIGVPDTAPSPAFIPAPVTPAIQLPASQMPASTTPPTPPPTADAARYLELGRLFADFLERGRQIYEGASPAPSAHEEPVVITGAALGLPGTDHVFDDGNIERLLRGDQFIDAIPMRIRKGMVEKNITRLVKTEKGEPRFEMIEDPAEVVKLAGRAGKLDLTEEFGYPEERVDALDTVTRLAIGAGLDALRDAGLPLAMYYKTTTTGTRLPVRWQLPDALRDDTGVIMTSAFPGLDSFAEETRRHYADQAKRQRMAELESLRARLAGTNHGSDQLVREIDRRIRDLKEEIEKDAYVLDRKFLLKVLSMGHSQFAEYIGARGPNTQINSACASTTMAVGLAQDWIRAGRCRRVIIVSADNVTSDNLLDWFGAGFLASGAAATNELVEDAATPFDRRRHGMIVGMGAASIVVESAEAARERGIRPICEVLGAETANSAFHATRLDLEHITRVMESLVSHAERRWGINRFAIAPQTVFVSHETYTPARGGSAQAEVNALRHVFGPAADQVVMANTKGFTGHAMATGIEDVLAVKSLETGLVPPVPNFREIDPDLGSLNLSHGGGYPVQYALRLGAGFGSQISMSLLRWVPTPDLLRPNPRALGFDGRIADARVWSSWLARISGYDEPELEVEKRTLRFRDKGVPGRATASMPDVEAGAASAPAAPFVTPAAAPANPAPVVVAEAPPPPAADPVQERVLEIVAAQTGYPPDMLDLDLDLEADLGVDTVKQAEMFAAVRQEWGIERDENLKLRDFPTLAHVIAFVRDRRPDLKIAGAPAPVVTAAPPRPAPQEVGTSGTVEGRVLEIVSEQTGYPIDMLDPDLDLEADLGVDTVKQAEMFAAVRQEWGIERDENLRLRDFPTLAHVVRFVYDRRPDLRSAVPAPVPATPAPSVPPAPAAPVTSAAAPAESIADAGDSVRAQILQLVADQTGYPVDMLDLDLDLEADLGIDTVKQAEMFAAIRGVYDIPRDENLQLRDYPTLGHVVQFVHVKRPDLSAPAAPAEAPATPAAPATPGAAPVTTDDPVKAKVLELVAAQTGYPSDMLDLDLDLEADLGIDTVKQAEMFAAIRGEYGIPRDESLQLRDYPTLAHVIRFVYERAPSFGDGADRSADVTDEPAPSVSARTVPDMEAAAVIPRRIVVPTLRPPLTLCKPTGVALGPGSRVVVMMDRAGVGAALVKRLERLGVEALAIDDAPSAESLVERIQGWLASGPIHGVYWLPALDEEGPIAGMNYDVWKEATRVRVKLLYTAARALYEPLGQHGTFLVSATRLGGQHGYDEAGAVNPLGGGVTGFTKTFKRERPAALVKAVDFEPSRKTAALADLLVDETLSDPGVVEVGYRNGLRWSVRFEERPLEHDEAGMALGKDTVFVITGAAGSIVSAITRDLARASGGTFFLLDRIPAPNPADPDVTRFVNDRDGLKRDLFERIKARGERATPAMVERELAGLERAHAALAAIRAVEEAGGTAHYRSVDLLDASGVAAAIDDVRQRFGRIDVLLHAGGLEISRFLPDKQPAEFDLVFDVKCDGWYNLLHAVGDMPVGATVAFTSVAGRFGNAAQTDYSAANDLLCKYASSFRTTRPGTRGIALDWSAWGGIGMASRGSIPKMMEMAGIEMLPPESAVPLIRRELTSSGWRGEMVVARSLGVLVEEWDETGGLETAPAGEVRFGPMTGRLACAALYDGLTVETTLDPSLQPFLDHHRIDGTPVLPGVMGIEAFAEAAAALLPGGHVQAVENVEFLAPVKFYRDEPRTLTLKVTYGGDAADVRARCELIGTRVLPNRTETTVHFAATVRLGAELLAPDAETVPGEPDGPVVDHDDVYRIYFHGPAYQVLARAWRNGEQTVGQLRRDLPPNHAPADLPLLMAPRLIELCFQTAGIAEIGTTGRMGLPRHVRRVTAFRDPDAATGDVYAVVRAGATEGSFDARVVDEQGTVLLALEGYDTITLPGNIAPDALRPLEAAMTD